jgi:hypothetical protein
MEAGDAVVPLSSALPAKSGSTTDGEDTPGSRLGLALGLVVAAQFVLQLDFSIVNVALPTIKRELHFAPADCNGSSRGTR